MAISINLLPTDYSISQKKREKFTLVQTVSVAALLLCAFIASVTVAARIIQTQNINRILAQTSVYEEKISSMKGKEASLVVLKNRIEMVGKLVSLPTKQTTVYEYLNRETPQGVIANSITLDRNGTAIVSAVSSDRYSLENLITNLIKEDFKVFKKVEIESLSRGRDGSFRGVFQLVPQ